MQILQVPSAAERFATDYFLTFARLLDPNLPPSGAPAEDGEATHWPVGQRAAFATIGLVSLWGMMAAILHYLA